MRLTCPKCGSKDIWQPRVKGTLDDILAKFGYAQAECRKCRRRLLIRQRDLKQRRPKEKAETGMPTAADMESRPAGPGNGASSQPTPALFPKPRTVIAADVYLRGEIHATSEVRIEGTVEGEIYVERARVVVAPTGHVEANITAGEVVIEGTVEGNVEADTRILLLSGASLTGDVRTLTLEMRDGARFTGNEQNREDTAPPSGESGTLLSDGSAE